MLAAARAIGKPRRLDVIPTDEELNAIDLYAGLGLWTPKAGRPTFLNGPHEDPASIET
jgi:hypothetical protein